MKSIKQILFISTAMVALAISCKDEDLDPYVKPGGGANGLGQFVSLVDGTSLIPPATQFYSQANVDAAVFFDENDQSKGIDYKLQWVSYDNRVTISNIELYIEYNETYSDADRNPLIASHGGVSKGPSYPAGKFWKTIPAGDARAITTLNLTPAVIYDVFKDNTFDYDGAGPNPAVNIFSANPQTDRTSATKRFYSSRSITLPSGSVTLAADQFRIRWRLITDAGEGIGSWSNSVCSETVGINCTGQWRVNKSVFNPTVAFAQRGQVGAVVGGVRQRPVRPLRSGIRDTVNIVFNRPIKTAPTVAATAATAAWVTLSGVVAYDNKDGIADNSFYVVTTATGTGTGNASLVVTGAVSTSDFPQVTTGNAASVAIDNTASEGAVAWSTSRVGRGQSSTLTVTFNEAMSVATADSVYISISGNGIDPITNRRLTLAADGRSGTYLYIYRDSSPVTDVVSGNLTVAFGGGKDVAGNALDLTSLSTAGLRTDVSSLDATTLVPIVNAAPPSAPTLFLPGDFDQKTQLKWQFDVTAALPNGATGGTLYYVVLAAGTTLPSTWQRTLDVQGVKVYNGYNTTGIASTAVFEQGTIPVSAGTTGMVYTTFSRNGNYDVYAYWVTTTGNASPVSVNLGPFTTTP